MVALNGQKARLLDLIAEVLKLVCDGKRNATEVADVLQVIKDKRDFSKLLLSSQEFSRVPTLLKIQGTITVPALPRFIASQKFVVDAKDTPKISYLYRDFRKWFLEKIEEPVEETQIRCMTLVKPSKDKQILSKLGKKAETTLGQIYALMEYQANSQDDVLLLDEWVATNLFYVRDTNGSLRAVYINWYDDGDGWHVYASSVKNSIERSIGTRVFFRN